MNDLICTLCGLPIPEDSDDFCDSNCMGFVHDSCLAEHEADAPNRYGDYCHDSRF